MAEFVNHCSFGPGVVRIKNLGAEHNSLPRRGRHIESAEFTRKTSKPPKRTWILFERTAVAFFILVWSCSRLIAALFGLAHDVNHVTITQFVACQG